MTFRTATCALAFAAIALAAACGNAAGPGASTSNEPVQTSASRSATAPSVAKNGDFGAPGQLAERLDCLRASGGVLLIGHRGGPTHAYPENAIETFDRTLKAGVRGLEIDIAETRDGVLILMHDDALERTTTGEGLVAERAWDEIKALRLETQSRTTAFSPPTLRAALDWAVETGAVVELDKKRSAAFEPIIAEVRAAGAENNVFIITYTDDQAIEVHTLAPELVITATVNSLDHLERLLAAGVKADKLVAWTGVERPNPDLWKALAARGVEAAFGTLGPRATSLDGQFWEDDDGSEYNRLIDDGLPILVTDLTDRVSRQLAGSMAKASACGF